MPPSQRDELGRFSASANEAADKLKDFSREIEDSAKASAESTRAKKEEAETAKAHSAFVGGLASASVGALSRAASAEDLDAGLSGLAQAGIKALRGIPGGELLAEASGLNRAERVLGTAADRTLDVTGDLARYGINVSDEFRSSVLNTAIEQEERVETERAKVSGDAFAPGRLGEQVAGQLERLAGIAEKIFERLAALGGGGGGG